MRSFATKKKNLLLFIVGYKKCRENIWKSTKKEHLEKLTSFDFVISSKFKDNQFLEKVNKIGNVLKGLLNGNNELEMSYCNKPLFQHLILTLI